MEKRKVLHQKVLELKGAIRVFCRIRPITAIDGTAVSAVDVKDQEHLVISLPRVEERRRAASAPLGGRSPSMERLAGRECSCESHCFRCTVHAAVVYAARSSLVHADPL
jgi:hypothetical protein